MIMEIQPTTVFGGPVICDWMTDLYAPEIFQSAPEEFPALQQTVSDFIPGEKTSYLLSSYSKGLGNSDWHKIINAEIMREILESAGLLPYPLQADFKALGFEEIVKEFISSEQTWYERIYSKKQPFENFVGNRNQLLLPGDILVLHAQEDAGSCDFENIFLLTRFAENGNPYSIGVKYVDGDYKIGEIDLFSTVDCKFNGVTGSTGFEIYRRISAKNRNGSYFYTIEASDTLRTISWKYFCNIEDIIITNQLTKKDLNIGQILEIPSTIQ